MLSEPAGVRAPTLFATAMALLVLSCQRSDSGREVSASDTGPSTLEPGQPEATAEQDRHLQNGDLIFHRSRSRQSQMVAALTGSEWTHMGVIFFREGKPFVFEAASPVRLTALDRWVARGDGAHYVVKRLRNADSVLTPDVIEKMEELANPWIGRPYDAKFQWSDKSFYCSELVYKLYDKGANVQIGALQRAREMNLGDPLVKKAIAARFGAGRFDPNETIISPGSMFQDSKLFTVSER